MLHVKNKMVFVTFFAEKK